MWAGVTPETGIKVPAPAADSSSQQHCALLAVQHLQKHHRTNDSLQTKSEIAEGGPSF